MERMVHGGVALARLAGGRLVLVSGGIPGELVRGEVEEVSGVLRAEVAEVLEPSPQRLPKPLHPGLDFGHIEYSRQLELKHEVVVDALRRAVRGPQELPEVAPVHAAPEQWNYRSAVQPVVVGGRLGYRLPNSDSAVPLDRDPVANEALDWAWQEIGRRPSPKGVRELAMRGNDRGETLLALVATSPQRTLLSYAHDLVRDGVAGVTYARFDARGRFRGGSSRLAGERRIRQVYGDFEVSVSVTSFAQPNPAAAGELYRQLRQVAGSGGMALELFAGSGIIALHLANSFLQVEAVEIDRASVSRGSADAKRLGIDNISFQPGDVRDALIHPEVELIAVDPPRAGLGRQTREAIEHSSADRLIYVSCDPATWARDVAQFVAGGWRLELAQPYDFYPHTHHVEILSLLSR